MDIGYINIKVGGDTLSKIKTFKLSLIVIIILVTLTTNKAYAETNTGFEYIDLDQKSEYPFSAICYISVNFNDNTSLASTGQLVDKDKILSCAHGLYVSETEIKKLLATRSTGRNIINSEELFNSEIDTFNKLEKEKLKERQKRIDKQLTEREIFVLEHAGIREKSDISEKVENRRRELEEKINYVDEKTVTEVGVRVRVSQEDIDKAIEKEKAIEKDVDKQIRLEILNEMQYKPVWEIDIFSDITVDFMYDTENSEFSNTDIYNISTNSVIIHENYSGDIHDYTNDLAILKTNNDIGYKYGWLGLISEVENDTKYSLAGYPVGIINNIQKEVLKDLNMNSITGNINTNIGSYSDNLYWYDLATEQGFSGAGLRTESKYGDDYRIVSIHYGKVGNTQSVGNRMTKDVIEWITSIN